MKQDEAFAGVTPALPRWPKWLEELTLWSPVREPGGVSDDVAHRDVAEDGLVEVLCDLEREVRDDWLHERRRVHHGDVPRDLNELPVAHNADGSPHCPSRYAHGRKAAKEKFTPEVACTPENPKHSRCTGVWC